MLAPSRTPQRPSGWERAGGPWLAVLLVTTACEGTGDEARAPAADELPPDVELASEAAEAHPSFSGYWQRGLAELSRYELKQSRYGEVHEGEAVWIFVTEPFDTEAQVKHEKSTRPPHVTTVLKLNAYRRFYTGVYPYTLMTSTFLPLEAREPLKLTFTSQEWCGQVFTQLNRLAESQYRAQWFSYFQAEGDGERTLETPWLEDGLWSLLRRDPEALPRGEITVLPAVHHVRLRHEALTPQKAVAELGEPQDGVRRYTLRYASGRRFEVTFEAAFPHGILGFEEDPGDGLPTTRATRTRALMVPYWERNAADDDAYRRALGLMAP